MSGSAGRRVWVAAGLPAVLVASLLWVPPAAASPGGPPSPGRDRSVKVSPVPRREPVPSDTDTAAPWSAAAVVWPSAASAVVDVSPVEASAQAAGSAVGVPVVDVGGLPVRVSAPASSSGDMLSGRRRAAGLAAGPSRVRVEVLSPAAGRSAGLPAVVAVSRVDGGVGGRVRLELGYAGFRDAYGGDWSSRLRMVTVPTCAASTPTVPACLVRGELSSWNNPAAGVVAAEVDLDGAVPPPPIAATGAAAAKPAEDGSAVVALAAGTDSETGSFARTSFSQTYNWQAGLSSGAFTWSYPMRVPPAPGGLEPEVALSYNSASVDGRTNAEAAQNSMIGEGWSFQPGYIERQYRPCADDNDNNPHYPNNTTGDLCWRDHNTILVWGGRSHEVVLDDATSKWHLADDDGSLVSKYGTSSGSDVVTGFWNNEHWKITTPDGTQYWFGRTQLPGWTTNKRTTNSVWGVQVVSNHAGEPCYSTISYLSSSCPMAWRWNLDYVVDRYGNSMSYWYTRERAKAGLGGSVGDVREYDRGGYLARIEYGTLAGNETNATPPAQVLFDPGDRCVTDPSPCWSGGKPVAGNWADTPWDLDCPVSASQCPGNRSPSFFITKRLAAVRTQVRVGSSWQTVDEWALSHSFPDTAEDAVKPALWLTKIVHTGRVGGSVEHPGQIFGGNRYINRADWNIPAGKSQIKRYRINVIHTEFGGDVIVSHEQSDCGPSALPDPDNNVMHCFPQWFTPPGGSPGWSWWNIYRVFRVQERDLVGGAPEVDHHYEHTTAGSSTNVLWHHNDNPWGASLNKRSWSDFRGWSNVKVITGRDGQTQSWSQYRYFRGMHDDRTGAGPGTRQVTAYTTEGDSWGDWPARAGFLLEQLDANGKDGPLVRRTVNNPWTQQTAMRVEPANLVQPNVFYAHFQRTANTWTKTRIEATNSWRTTQVDHTWDTAFGVETATTDHGDIDVADDDTCTTIQHAISTSYHLTEPVAHTRTTNCAAQPGPSDVLAGVRNYYDNSPTLGAVPGRGLLTRTETLAGFAGTTPTYVTTATSVYDAHGRPTSVTDPLDRTTKTAYTPPTGGPVTAVKVTNPLGHATTTNLHPAWGSPTSVVDPNGKTTTASYSPLGELAKVWLPGRATNLTPNAEYTYMVTKISPTYVQSKLLGPNGNQITSYDLFDGLLRPRQTQTPAPQANGGSVIADTQYDSRGLVVKESTLSGTSGPSSTLAGFADAAVATQRRITFDGAGRQATDQLWSLGVEKWRTTTTYDGDRTNVDPPAGGTPITKWIDALGRTTALWQYRGEAPSGAHDAMTYGYDRLGRLTAAGDAAGNAWGWEYDLRGRKTKAVDPDHGTTTMTYDDADELETTKDARNIKLVYTYDDLGRKETLHRDSVTGPTLASWTYDSLAKGQLTSSTRFDGGKAYTSAVTGYDDGYRPRGASVTVPPGEGDLSRTWASTMTYKVDGSIDTQTYPAAGGLTEETVTYSYDNAGALLTMAGQDTYVSATTYDPLGGIKQRILGNGTKRVRLTTTLDEATRRLAKVGTETERPGASNSWDEKFAQTYSYDAAGNLTSTADVTGGTTVSNECFSYDYLRRLTEAWTTTATACQSAPSGGGVGGPDPYWRTYAYDTTGNRTRETIHGTGGAADVIRNYTYPGAGGKPHALSSVTGPAGGDSFGYDEVGNTTTRNLSGKPGQTLTWDPEGHLATLTENGQTTSYVYDASGNRLIRRTPQGSTLYLGAVEIQATPAGPKCVRYYSHGGAVIASRTSSAQLSWHTDDHHGTAQLTIAASTLAVTRRKQTPFGQPRGTQPAWPTDRGFVGGTTDPTGLTHLGAREYDPTIGRFISVDPVQDLSDPQQWHGYAYANNNPTSASDPTGLISPIRDESGRPVTDRGGTSTPTAGSGPRPSDSPIGRKRDDLVTIGKKVTISKYDPNYEIFKTLYEDYSSDWTVCLWILCSEEKIWGNICHMATCPKDFVAALYDPANIFDPSLSPFHGDGKVLLGSTGRGGFMRSLTNPKSMVGVTEAELRAMIPSDWDEQPIRKGQGVRFGTGRAGANSFGRKAFVEFNYGNPLDPDPLHRSNFVRLSAGGMFWRVAAAGNPIEGEGAVQIRGMGNPGPGLKGARGIWVRGVPRL